MSLNEGVTAAIIEYVEAHKRPDSIEIANHVGISCDITLRLLHELETKGVVGRYLDGNYYVTTQGGKKV